MDLCNAVSYLHSQKVVHRDLKPDNVGFDRSGRLKVFDFDVARVLPEAVKKDDRDTGSENAVFRLTKKVGSPRYMSPEVALGESYNEKTDVYALGLLAYEVLSLKRPFGSLAVASRNKNKNNAVSSLSSSPSFPPPDCVRVPVSRARGDVPDGLSPSLPAEAPALPKASFTRGTRARRFSFRLGSKRTSSSSSRTHETSDGAAGSSTNAKKSNDKHKTNDKPRVAAKYANFRPLLPIAAPEELALPRHRRTQPPPPPNKESGGNNGGATKNSTRSQPHSTNDVDFETSSLFWTRSLRTAIDRSWSYHIPARPSASELRSLLGAELDRLAREGETLS